MAMRLTTRLSAGAALVTGLGMIGLATAVPAQAETTLTYSCTTPLGAQELDVTLDTDAPEVAVIGDALSVTPSGTVTLNNQISNAMAGALKWESVSADIPNVEAVLSDGTTTAPFTTDLSIAKTQIYDADSGWTQDETPDLPITGPATDVTPTVAGTYTISAPETFNVTFNGYDAAGEAGTLSPIDSTCSYVSGDKVIDTVTVTDTPPAPVTDDWFSEPSSLPITSDGKSFTVKGTAEHAGTMTVVLLDGDKKVLKTYTWDVAEGDNTKDFAFVDGTDYVRLVSSECVDSNGDDESVTGSGCNAEYRASWVDDDTDTPGDGDAGDGDTGTDDGATTPEIPDVVQTDGFQRVPAAGDDNTAAFLLGGALLAGAGASVVVVARRRKGAQL